MQTASGSVRRQTIDALGVIVRRRRKGSKPTPSSERALRRAEASGLRIAIVGRSLVLAPIAVFLAFYGDGLSRYFWGALIALFIGIGVYYYRIAGSRREKLWFKYAFFMLDIAAAALAVYAAPLGEDPETPRALVFRLYGPEVFYMLVGAAGLTLSPRLVLATGLGGCLAWLSLTLLILAGQPDPRTSLGIPPGLSAQEFTAYVLAPDFISVPNRIAEALGVILVASLLAFATWRARRLVRRRVSADMESARIAGAFGEYVPTQVVGQARDGGDGAPHANDRVEATMLYLDIEGFTRMTENRSTEELIEILSRFFDEASAIIEANRGSVLNLNGDALLAAFNTPRPNPDHASAALRCALEILSMLKKVDFLGERLAVRIGLATGDVAAGPVGGKRRRAYTVHGDAVNLAARLEDLCKEHKTRLLISADTADRLGGQWALTSIGKTAVRGRSRPVRVFKLQKEAAIPPAREPTEAPN